MDVSRIHIRGNRLSEGAATINDHRIRYPVNSSTQVPYCILCAEDQRRAIPRGARTIDIDTDKNLVQDGSKPKKKKKRGGWRRGDGGAPNKNKRMFMPKNGDLFRAKRHRLGWLVARDGWC